jgi:uncharacterized protein YqeY
MDGTSPGVRDRLRHALTAAMRERDSVAVAALRSALGAIDNAEAVDAAQRGAPAASHPRLAGTVAGLGAGEVPRRELTEPELETVVRAEVAERAAAAADYDRAGRADRAERLRGEAAALAAQLTTPPGRSGRLRSH